MRLPLFLCMALAIPFANAGEPVPPGKAGMVPVVSEYSDIETGRKVQITGTGNLVVDRAASGDRWFILTDAHVSQGENLRIQLGGKAVSILGRLADNRNDLEFIEIAPPDEKPLLIYIPQRKVYVLSQDRLEDWTVRKGFSGREIDPERTVAMSAFAPSEGFLLVPPWMKVARRDLEVTLGNGLLREGDSIPHVEETLYGQELYAEGLIIPGTSGAPLMNQSLLPDGSSSVRLKGIAKRYLNHFKGSYFATADTVIALRDRYLSGERGHTDETRWHYGHQTTFRDFGHGTREIITQLNSGNAGNATSRESGGGTSSDGGSTARTTASADIPAGMLWHGKPVLGIRLTDARGSRNFQATVATLDAVERYQKIGGRAEPIPTGSNLMELARQRFRRPSLPFSAVRSIAGFPGQIRFEGIFLSFDSRGMRAILRMPSRDPQAGYSEGELLTFTLDPQGRHREAGAAHYQPVISVTASNGESYRIDISGLFFEDPSQSRRASFSPSLRVRNEASQRELEIARFDDYGHAQNLRSAFHQLAPCFEALDPFSEVTDLLTPLQAAITKDRND